MSDFTIIYKGMIWFCMSHLLIIFNDINSYIFGVLFGKTPLIKLSPKKTVEGFLGGIFGTTIIAVFCGSFLTRFPYMICPE